MEIKIGDVVYLKSDVGGQKFTVGSSTVGSDYLVHWFDSNLCELKKMSINLKSVVKAE